MTFSRYEARTEAFPKQWEGQDGGQGRCCRGASSSDNSASYYVTWMRKQFLIVSVIFGCQRSAFFGFNPVLFLLKKLVESAQIQTSASSLDDAWHRIAVERGDFSPDRYHWGIWYRVWSLGVYIRTILTLNCIAATSASILSYKILSCLAT